MSQVTFVPAAHMLVAGPSSVGLTSIQDCALSGAQAWNRQLKYVIPDCKSVSTSPDGKIRLEIDTSGRVQLSVGSGTIEVAGHAIEPPGMVS